MRKVGPRPNDYQALEKLLRRDEIGGLVPIDSGGAGALAISRRALEAVRARVGGNDWVRYRVGPAGLRSISEDMWFYEQARACGIPPYLDADLWCGHERREIVGPADHEPYRVAFQKAQEEAVV
jgi:hypothetical protein